MEIFLVGGAVRDKLLGLEVTDRDWVAVGATPEHFLDQGYRPVGKDFPVFLHPRSHEEYALARTERKTGHGYTGFEFHAAPDVTLEQDLERRDLTINAMAETADGELIDPYDGNRDIRDRVLRHVSNAFAEDPVRILRVARFAARYADLGFTVHPSTLDLMTEMVDNNEVDHLVAERTWTETQRALAGQNPQVYFEVLRSCGALQRIFPELDALYGVPQPAKWHPEIDTGVHTMMVLQQASLLSESAQIRFAALVHDLGKGTTPKDILPSHKGHEHRSVKLVNKMCERLRIPKKYRNLSLLVAELHGKIHRAFELRASTILKLLQQTDAFRRAQRFDDFLVACEADSRGRKGLEDVPYPQADYLRGALSHTEQIPTSDFSGSDLSGEEIAREIYAQRLTAIRRYKKNYESEQHGENQ